MKMKTVVLSVLCAGLLASVSWAGEESPLKDQKAKDSYSLGYQFGHNLAGQAVEIDQEVLIAAIRDAFADRKPVLSENEIRNTIKDLRQKTYILQERQTKERLAKNREEGKTFLAANGKKEGVVTLPSGVQYKVIREGKGTSPKPTDGVKVRYRGTLVNGAEFDSNRELADSELPLIPVTGVNKGWTEALQLMKPGSKWQLFIPAELGYGEVQYGRIPANSVLVFELELLSVVDGNAAASAVLPGQASSRDIAESESDRQTGITN